MKQSDPPTSRSDIEFLTSAAETRHRIRELRETTNAPGMDADNAVQLTAAHEPDVFSTRNALLRAAAHVFAEHGLRAASVRQIAAEAGVNNTLITYHFGSKEKLWFAVVGWLFDEVAKGAASRKFDLSGPDLREQFRTHLKDMLIYSPVKVMLSRIITKEPSAGIAQSVRNEKLPAVYAGAKAYFNNVHELGIATRLTGEQMFQVFSPIIHWWLTAPHDVELIKGEAPGNDEAAQRQADLLFQLFVD